MKEEPRSAVSLEEFIKRFIHRKYTWIGITPRRSKNSIGLIRILFCYPRSSSPAIALRTEFCQILVRILSDSTVGIPLKGFQQLSTEVRSGLFESDEIRLDVIDLRCCWILIDEHSLDNDIWLLHLLSCNDDKFFKTLFEPCIIFCERLSLVYRKW
jgi:hypothetical protein